MTDSPRIETARLILRLPQREDFEGYAELFADADAVQFIGGPSPRAAAWRRFLQMPGAWAVQGFAMFSVIDKTSGEWLGQAGPWQPEGWNGTEVGWSFRRSAWGKGYATEAAIATIDWAFANLGWTEVIHNIAPGNTASIALAERLGSRYRCATRMPAPFDTDEVGVWAQTREQWSARRASEINT
ncbi:MAG: GNAT family N-acetyltransferase [Lysobacterales bacterium]